MGKVCLVWLEAEKKPTLDEVRLRSPQMTNPAAPRAALSPMVWIKSFCRKHTLHMSHLTLHYYCILIIKTLTKQQFILDDLFFCGSLLNDIQNIDYFNYVINFITSFAEQGPTNWSKSNIIIFGYPSLALIACCCCCIKSCSNYILNVFKMLVSAALY